MLYNVPPRNAIFTGRDKELADLPFGFRRSPLLVMNEDAGMGKTQIAMEYCYRSSVYETILWLNASSRAILMRDVRTLSVQLSLPDQVREDEHLLSSSFKRWLKEHSRWLLVLDAVDDFTLLNLVVPSMTQGHFLVTTRRDPFGSPSSSPIPSGLGVYIFLLLQQAGFILKEERQQLDRRSRPSLLHDSEENKGRDV